MSEANEAAEMDEVKETNEAKEMEKAIEKNKVTNKAKQMNEARKMNNVKRMDKVEKLRERFDVTSASRHLCGLNALQTWECVGFFPKDEPKSTAHSDSKCLEIEI